MEVPVLTTEQKFEIRDRQFKILAVKQAGQLALHRAAQEESRLNDSLNEYYKEVAKTNSIDIKKFGFNPDTLEFFALKGVKE